MCTRRTVIGTSEYKKCDTYFRRGNNSNILTGAQRIQCVYPKGFTFRHFHEENNVGNQEFLLLCAKNYAVFDANNFDIFSLP